MDCYYLLEMERSGSWHLASVETATTPHTYAFLALLFGVRNELFDEPLAARRGLPRDASPEARIAVGLHMDEEGKEWLHGHSVSYFTWNDALRLQRDWHLYVGRCFQLLSEVVQPEWQDILRRFAELAHTYGNARMVVWFDG